MTWRPTLLAIWAACAVSQAQGHAFLQRADPRVGSVVSTAPSELKLWFDQELEPAFSTVEVRDANGKRVDAAGTRIDDKDRMLLHVALPALQPGAYRVTWRVVSVDTHVSEGRYTFRVGP